VPEILSFEVAINIVTIITIININIAILTLLALKMSEKRIKKVI